MLLLNREKVFKQPIHNIKECDEMLFRAMLTCHSLARLDNALTGDPLDIKMFKATGWEYLDDQISSRFENACPFVTNGGGENDDAKNEEIAIVKQFAFSASRFRMTVLCKSSLADHMDVYCKGAPEMIVELCRPQTGKQVLIQISFFNYKQKIEKYDIIKWDFYSIYKI